MSTSASPVLIAGAGPVGLTMAASLLRQGIACRIIDKAPAPTDKSKALVLWSRTLELFEPLGLSSTLVDAGLKIRGASIYGGSGRLVHVELNEVDSPYAFPLMIPQSETERVLTEHLSREGLAVERRVELLSFAQTPDGVSARLRRADGSEEIVQTPWLLGCDGAHSTVRHTLDIPFTGSAEPNDWLLADVHVAGPIATDEMSIYWHAKGILVFFPITANRFRVIADLGASAGRTLPPEPTIADVQAKIDERGPSGITVSQPVWLAYFHINERKVSEYRHGRVFLAGDAAHIHSPAGGQGMNTGMQDAFNLAWKLALVERGVGRAKPLLDSYSIERSAIGDQVLHGASMMTLVATLRNPAAQFLRNHVASALSSFSMVRDKFANSLCELSINYRHGPLAAESWHGAAGSIRAGDRLPDAPLANPGVGSSKRLYELLSPTRFTLLLLAPSGDAPELKHLNEIAVSASAALGDALASVMLTPAVEADAAPSTAGTPLWVDTEGRLFEQLAVKEPALVLVRPDGYIGYRCQKADGAALAQYLDRILLRRS